MHAGLSGLTGVSEALDAIEARAARFHRKGAQKTTLAQGKKRLNEIAALLKASRLTAGREQELQSAVEAAEAAFSEADAELKSARGRQEAGKAAQIWYDNDGQLSAWRSRLDALPSGPDLGDGVAGQIRDLAAKIHTKSAQAKRAKEQSETLADSLSELPLDPEAETFADLLAEFDATEIDGAPLMDRARTAWADLERRKSEQDASAQKLRDFAARLGVGQTDQYKLAFSAEDLERLTQAVDGARAAATAARSAKAEVQRAQEMLGTAPREPKDVRPLQEACAAWQRASNITHEREGLRLAQAQSEEATLGLPPDWAALVETGLPTASAIEDAISRFSNQKFETEQARKATRKADAEALAATKLREARSSEEATTDQAAIEETRRARDLAWQSHRAALDRTSAEAFEARMHADDTARAQFYASAAARERLAQAVEAEAKAIATLETAQMTRDRCEADLAASQKGVADMAARLGLRAGFAPSDLAPRLTALRAAEKAASAVQVAQTTWEDAAETERATRAHLEDIATLFDLDVGAEGFDQKVAMRLAAAEQEAETWARWLTAQENVADLRQAAELRATEAQAHLDALAGALPLHHTSADALQSILPVLRALSGEAETLGTLTRRITDMEHALRLTSAFAARLAALGAEGKDTPLAIFVAAKELLETARAAQVQAQSLQAQIDAARHEAKEADQAVLEAQRKLDSLFADQGGADMGPTERVRLLEERDGLRGKVRNTERTRQTARDAVEGVLFDEERALIPNASRAGEVAQILEDAQRARDEALKEKSEAARVYAAELGAETRADLATEAAALQEELRDSARDAAVARLGAMAARGALKHLATERRGDMLKDVERAFVTMTAPKWRGVEVWSEAEGEKLVGVEADGRTTPADKMSTGTMGQLYFALRLAGYKSYARSPGPRPMVLDDIMETFDDDRARAALALCAEIGLVGQAIMFTHHLHLVDIAQELLPNVGIVDLTQLVVDK